MGSQKACSLVSEKALTLECGRKAVQAQASMVGHRDGSSGKRRTIVLFGEVCLATVIT